MIFFRNLIDLFLYMVSDFKNGLIVKEDKVLDGGNFLKSLKVCAVFV